MQAPTHEAGGSGRLREALILRTVDIRAYLLATLPLTAVISLTMGVTLVALGSSATDAFSTAFLLPLIALMGLVTVVLGMSWLVRDRRSVPAGLPLAIVSTYLPFVIGGIIAASLAIVARGVVPRSGEATALGAGTVVAAVLAAVLVSLLSGYLANFIADTQERRHQTAGEMSRQSRELQVTRQSVAESQEQYHSLFENSPLGVYRVSPDGKYLDANPALIRMLGYDTFDELAEHTLERSSHDTLAATGVFYERIQHTGEVIGLETSWRKGARSLIAVRENAREVRNEMGTLLYYEGTVEDATERKRTEEALAAEEERLAVTLRSIGDAVIAADRRDNVVLLNKVAEMLTGYPRIEAMGRALSEILATLGEHAAEQIMNMDSTGLPFDVAVEGPSRQLFEVRSNPISEGPEAGGRVLMLRDVTTARGAQEKMDQEGRLAAVGQLAAGIAHDFNNLLTGVIGSAELLQTDAAVPDSAKQLLQMVADEGHRAARLTRQILDFSRRSISQRHALELDSLLQDIHKLLQHTIPETIRLEFEIEPGNFLVEADSTQIQQVVTNLAVNARDAMQDGGELRLRLAQLNASQEELLPDANMALEPWVVFTVSDTGTGMAPDVLERIFEPFYTTKDIGEGTGLGLSQVYGIVKQHSGHVAVESEPGKGTTFTIYFPVAAKADVPQGDGAQGQAPHGDGETLLLVEDQPQVLKVLQATLERLNYKVLTATNGREGLAEYGLHKQEIALVLTDITMPQLGGVEMSNALHEQDPDVKVIALTGYPLQESAREQLAEGMLAVLQKPPPLMELAQAVHKGLRGERM